MTSALNSEQIKAALSAGHWKENSAGLPVGRFSEQTASEGINALISLGMAVKTSVVSPERGHGDIDIYADPKPLLKRSLLQYAISVEGQRLSR